MKIALCDDEQNDLKQLRQHLERYDSSLDVTAFCTARELLSATEHIFFNLIFLDIEMEAPNGFEAARQLMSRSETPLIIFTTKSAEYSIAGYGLAFRYLKKPISYPVMEEVLHLALEQLIPQQVSFPIGGAEKVFSVSDITYFETFDHELNIHTIQGSYQLRETLSSLSNQLGSAYFAQPHRSFLVNLAFVDAVSEKDVFLTTGERIYLSRPKRAAFQDALSRYLRR